jgi:ABC-type multidrug transport system ATPase subunit
MAAISVQGLTKRFGSVTAVDDLSFDVPPGSITGFIGPNGAGKTTTLRIVLGLVRPTAGTALVDGVPYVRLDQPTRHVGAVLEASGFHPGRKARDHLRVLASRGGIPVGRVDDVLAEVGADWYPARRRSTSRPRPRRPGRHSRRDGPTQSRDCGWTVASAARNSHRRALRIGPLRSTDRVS